LSSCWQSLGGIKNWIITLEGEGGERERERERERAREMENITRFKVNLTSKRRL
jgi:hypothetical protein